MKKNVASQVVGAQMVSATDGSAFTGTVTCRVTGDGGTQALGSVGSGVCTHEGNGYHTYTPAQAETNYDLVAFTFTGTGAVPVTVQIYTSFPQTGDNYARIGANGAGLSAVPWNAAWDAEVQSEVDDALVAIHLDHLLAADYDPSSKPGAATALFNELIENDAGVSRFTANALEQAPAGGGGGGGAGATGGVRQQIAVGQTNFSATIFIPDPAAADGSGKAGLTAADLTVSYARVETDNDVIVTNVTTSLNDLAALTSSFTAWGLKEIDSTLQPGYYRLDIADAVFAAGATLATVYAMITTSAASPYRLEFELYTALTVDGIADTVWQKVLSGGLPANSAGKIVFDNLNAAITTRAPAATALSTDQWTNGRAAAIDTIGTGVAAIQGTVAAVPNLSQIEATHEPTLDALTELGADLVLVKAVADEVKAKTDQLTFTQANRADVNVRHVNNIAVGGSGTSGDPWRPA